MAIDALIFDFDGVIIDTETLDFQTWQEVFRARRADFEMEWRAEPTSPIQSTEPR